MPPQKILSANQAAILIDIDSSTFHRWVAQGRAPEPDFTAKKGTFWLKSTIVDFAASLNADEALTGDSERGEAA